MAKNRRNSRAAYREQVRGRPKGSTDWAGAAYLFLFPFDIFHEAAGDPVEFSYRGGRMRLYPPFADDPAGNETLRQVQIESIPRLPDTTPPHIGAPRLTRAAIQFSGAQSAPAANALRIDFLGVEDSPAASTFVDRFLELSRMFTLQWWITRDRRADEGYLRNTFKINDRGERLDGIAVLMKKYGGFRIEKVMTRITFESIVYHAARDRRCPLSLLALCDAIYFHGVGDTRRAFIEAAIACEVLLAEHGHFLAERLGKEPERIRRELVKAKFEDRLASDVLGRSFAADRPEEYEWLKTLWVARNNVAHGKPPVLIHKGNRLEQMDEGVTTTMKAVVELFMWIQQFGSFEPLPPA